MAGARSPDSVRPGPIRRGGRLAWVVGGGGLLGGAVGRRLRASGRDVRTARVPWGDPDEAVEALLGEARDLAGASPSVYWCAGAGVVGTGPEQLGAEIATLQAFLERWQPAPGTTMFLASSAGGVFAGSEGSPFTEHSVPVPLAPYGHAKLQAEETVREFAVATGVPTFIGRLSNLYGPGQNLAKPQGLITLLCRAQLTRQPLNIYVSLDTRRDYLFVDDAARMAVAGVAAVSERGGAHVKILGSGQSSTIGAILGDLRRLNRRRPPVVLGSSEQARFQVRDLRLRSVVWPPLSTHARTPLIAGMAATMQSIQASLGQSTERV